MNPHLPSPPSRPRTGLLAAGLLLVPVILGAQPAKSPSGDEPIVLSAFQVSTNQDKGYRPGNSVSATRIDTPIKDLPFAVSAFTEQFIEDIGARELKDIARFAPSVTNNAREFNAGNSKFAVRGFDANPMRNGFPGTAYIDVATVQRVEIIKGPSTLLYGQIEAGGAINYVTKQPQLRRSATLNLQFGSYGYDRAHLDTNQPIVPGRVLARLNVVHEHDFEYYNFHHGHTRVIAPVVTWKIDDKTTLTLDYQWFERREKAQVFFLPQIQVPLNNRALYPSATGGVKFPTPTLARRSTSAVRASRFPTRTISATRTSTRSTSNCTASSPTGGTPAPSSPMTRATPRRASMAAAMSTWSFPPPISPRFRPIRRSTSATC